MKYLIGILALAAVMSTGACSTQESKPTNAKGPKAEDKAPKLSQAELEKLHRATFAGGCFWCLEGVFESIRGVGEVISGYSGGKEDNPTYEMVGHGSTGHAEAVEVYYDSSVVDYPTLVNVFFASIDPFQVNGQGPDHGTQYRSIVFYRHAAEQVITEKKIAEVSAASGSGNRKVAVEVVPFAKFWEAETYHQDYILHHPENPYVQHESIPRIRRTQKQVMSWVKPEKVVE